MLHLIVSILHNELTAFQCAQQWSSSGAHDNGKLFSPFHSSTIHPTTLLRCFLKWNFISIPLFKRDTQSFQSLLKTPRYFPLQKKRDGGDEKNLKGEKKTAMLLKIYSFIRCFNDKFLCYSSCFFVLVTVLSPIALSRENCGFVQRKVGVIRGCWNKGWK